MKPVSQPPKMPFRLSDSAHHQLNMYALAASAAGVGILALAQPAESRIVFSPANKPLPLCGHNTKLCFKLDLNHDGIVDFVFPFSSQIKPMCSSPAGLWVENPVSRMETAKTPKNEIWGTLTHRFRVASTLSSGVSVGDNSVKFNSKNNVMRAWCFSGTGSSDRNRWGPWAPGLQDRYLGLKFYTKGKAHYGWARLSITGASDRQPILTGYAYETVADKPIVTGKTKGPDVITPGPGSLGRLSQGSAGRLGK